MPEELPILTDAEHDVAPEGTPRSCRRWVKTFQELMEAYWSMDLGALLTSGHVGTDPEFPSNRRKSLSAFFRGRVLTGLCEAAEGRKGQSILQRCKTEGPENLAWEFAEMASTSDDSAAEIAANSPYARQMAAALADPLELPSLCHFSDDGITSAPPSAHPPELPSQCLSPNDGISTDLLLAMLSTGPRDDKAFGKDMRLAEFPSQPRRGCSQELDTDHAGTILSLEQAKESLLDGGLSVESSAKLRKTRPKPLSVPPVAGPICWAETANGCFIELPTDPKKHAARQAQKKEKLSKCLVAKRPQVTRSDASKELVPHGSKQLIRKPPVPKQKRAQIATPKSDCHDPQELTRERATQELNSDVLAHVQSGMTDWWFQEGKGSREWQDFKEEEDSHKEAVQSPASTSARSRYGVGRSRTIDFEKNSQHRQVSQSGGRTQHLVQRSTTSVLGKDTKKKDAESVEFRHLVSLARKYNIHLEDLREALQAFRSLDSDSSGQICADEFQNAVRHFCNVPEDEPIPTHLLLPHRRMDHDQSGGIDFEEFLLWTLTSAYTEEFMVSSPAERNTRRLARNWKVPLPEVEKLKSIFDSFDSDSNGEVEKNEFICMLYKLMNIRSGAGVSEKRMERYWQEVYHDGCAGIRFEEFLAWYMNEFPEQLPSISKAK